MSRNEYKINPHKRFLLNLHNNYKRAETRLHELKYLFWECTLKCNLNCLHCGSDCHKDVQVKDMPAKDFFNVLDLVKARYNDPSEITVVITGGEPLLRKDLEDCGREIRKRGFRWGIVTNGYQYTQDRHNSLMAAGMGALTMSFDGMHQSHNWLRNNKNSFERTLNALDIIRQEKRLNYDMVTCVNKRNINELEQVRELFIKKGIKAWRLFTISPIGRAKEMPELHLNKNEFRQMMEFIKQSRKQKTINVKLSCEGFVGKDEGKVRDQLFFCRAGINIASVLSDGSIGACPNIDPSFIQGNIYKDNFTDVWENRFEIMRNRSWTKTGQCNNCQFWKYCQGNGLHWWNDKRDNVIRCHCFFS